MPETHRAAMAGAGSYSGDAPIPRLGFESRGRQSFKNVDEPVEVLAVRSRTEDKGKTR